ncbi:MAG: GGDEF domain-containing protein [Bdellovibrionales bacterium]
MVVGGELFQAGLWSKQAYERLSRDNLPPTPRNYAVYYEYASGRNFELSTAYDLIVAHGKMTQQCCDEFYYKYVVSDTEKEFLEGASKVLNEELAKVLQLLNSSAKGTGEFEENLGVFSNNLKKIESVDMLREAVKKISEETKHVTAQNEKLQVELAETSAQLSAVRGDFDRVHREAQVDPLTQVGNRMFFDQEIVRALSEAREKGTMLSMLMIDIDHFKKFNDTHGHLVGDQVLRLVARTLVENLKGRDVIARYGGEEFVIILPDTRLQDSVRVADILRSTLSTKQITRRGTNEVIGAVTISIGAAEYISGDDGDALIARADSALYEAKQTGRNRVCMAAS